MDQTIHDGFGDHRILKEFQPPLRFDLGSDDERSFLIAFFEDVDQGGGFFVAVVSKPEIIEDEGFGFSEAFNVMEVAAGSLGSLDFLEEEINGEKQS